MSKTIIEIVAKYKNRDENKKRVDCSIRKWNKTTRFQTFFYIKVAFKSLINKN